MGFVNLTLPYPPSVNSYWRTTSVKPRQFGSGMKTANRSPISVYISEKGRAFRTAVIHEVMTQRAAKRYVGRLSVSIVLHPGDRRVRDIDNVLKALLDSLSHAGVYNDDGQIDEIKIVRGEIIYGGLCKVTISEIKA